MLISRKYIVWKLNDAGQYVPLEEGQFFVLRDGDALGTMTLRSYGANALQLIDWDINPLTGERLTNEEKEQLSLRADGSHTLANEWAGKTHKIPD